MIAVDGDGHVAAGTSTNGMTHKVPGYVDYIESKVCRDVFFVVFFFFFLAFWEHVFHKTLQAFVLTVLASKIWALWSELLNNKQQLLY